MTLLTLQGVGKRFANGATALKGVDLAVAEGEFVAILGASGCGKSTLLRIVAGLAEPSEGSVAWGGAPPPPGKREAFALPSPASQEREAPSPVSAANGGGSGWGQVAGRRIGFVFQDATLMPWARALDNVRLPLRLAGLSRSESEGRAADALAAVGLGGFERAWPRELSGGMRMRVSLARALVTEPSILLMDEPFAALDEITRHRLNDDLLALWAQRRMTVIFVTHSVYESVYLASRVLVMAARPGRVFAEFENTAPAPRAPGFRTAPDYMGACAAAQAALAEAMAA